MGVQGKDAPILTVRAEDAAAYELPFEPGVRAKRPSVRGLAAYWAALLQDYFTLFVQKQRPLAVLALSPRGRVLMDIYSAALRVPGATGVPISALRPITPTMAKGLRDLALVLPAEKESRVTVAVEGLWTGTMEETTGGPKPIQVRFEQAGGKLGGSLSTSAGKIGMNTPAARRVLPEERGALRRRPLGLRPHLHGNRPGRQPHGDDRERIGQGGGPLHPQVR